MSGDTSSHYPLPWDTIPAMLEDNFRRYASNPAILDENTRLSYEKLGNQVKQLAASLTRAGIVPGDIIVIWASNSWQWIACALACWWVGGVLAPVSARLKGMEALPLLQSTRTRILFTSSMSNGADLPAKLCEYIDATESTFSTALPDLKLVVDFAGQGENDLHRGWDNFLQLGANIPAPDPARISPTDTCQILFTSGTTGRPKGVMRGHRQVLRASWDSSQSRGYSDQDCMLIVPPFSHVGGLNGASFRCITMGMSQIVISYFDPGLILDYMETESVTCMSGPSSMFQLLLSKESAEHPVFQKLRFISTGAAEISPTLIYDLKERGVDSVCSPYGLTECSPISETLSHDTLEVVANTVGKPVPGLQVKIVDDDGNEVDPGERGEILVSGYGVMQGYFNDDTLTRSVITEDGWLHTGDMGSFTSDGNLQIVGRKKDMAIINGFNVYPAEVEKLLLKSEMLFNVSVVGTKDDLSVEQIVAFVIPVNVEDFNKNALMKWARKNMADYKIPHKLLVIGELPRNVNGKVDKKDLQSQAASLYINQI